MSLLKTLVSDENLRQNMSPVSPEDSNRVKLLISKLKEQTLIFRSDFKCGVISFFVLL